MKKHPTLTRRDFVKLAGLLPPALLALSGSPTDQLSPLPQSSSSGRMNVIVVVFDALTARNMSVYGYPRPNTPNIENLAKRAYVFHRHYAAGSFTSPGTASLLTGVYPWTHRAFNLTGEMLRQYSDLNIFAQFAPEYRTFAFTHNEFVSILLHQMKDHIGDWIQTPDISLASFDTISYLFTNDYFASANAEGLVFWRGEGPSSSFVFSKLLQQWRKRKMAQVNKQTRGQYPLGLPNNTFRHFFTLEQAINKTAAEAVSKNNPFMGYVHYIPPHAPYVPSKKFFQLFKGDDFTPTPKPTSRFVEEELEDIQSDRRLYDAFIAEVDAEFGRLYRKLKRSGVLDNTILVLTSDHGELFERGLMGHNTPALYEPLTNVPLLIWMPGDNQRHDIYTPTSAVDVMPTLLALNNLPIPEWVEGSPLPEVSAQPGQNDRSVFTLEAKRNPKYAKLGNYSLALVRGDYKLVQYVKYEGIPDYFELYNLAEDPEELTDLYGTTGDLENGLRQELTDTILKRDAYFKRETSGG
jgi:arylsulfatase A-like enzyme